MSNYNLYAFLRSRLNFVTSSHGVWRQVRAMQMILEPSYWLEIVALSAVVVGAVVPLQIQGCTALIMMSLTIG